MLITDRLAARRHITYYNNKLSKVIEEVKKEEVIDVVANIYICEDLAVHAKEGGLTKFQKVSLFYIKNSLLPSFFLLKIYSPPSLLLTPNTSLNNNF